MANTSGVDVAVIGGGPAGLSAALLLGRCRRRVELFDDGHYRNEAAVASHGFLTRDGASPALLRSEGRRQLERYEVRRRELRVLEVHPVDGHFVLGLSDGTTGRARKVLLATGLKDELPAIEGLRPLYGRSVFHCPFCDGFEQTGRATAVLGFDQHAVKHALGMLTWTDDVVLLTDGPLLGPTETARLESAGIRIIRTRIRRLEGKGGLLRRVQFADGTSLSRSTLFFASRPKQRSSLAKVLGCTITRHGTVAVDHRQSTGVAGVFAAGDTTPDAQFIVIAAAEGVKAALSINRELQREALRWRRRAEAAKQASPGR